MNCRTFHQLHVAFVDDTISGAERTEMAEHLGVCAGCASYNARVRRSLLLVRNLPRIEPSPEFRKRLRVRLLAAALMPEPPFAASRLRWVAAAAVLLAVGYAAYEGATNGDTRPLIHPPVVATLPEPEPSLATSPALAFPAVMASFAAGMAVWPAALVADQAPDYFVNATFASDNLTR